MDTITYAGVDLHKDSMTIAVTDSLSNDPYNDAKITKIHCKSVNKVSDFFTHFSSSCVVGGIVKKRKGRLNNENISYSLGLHLQQ